MATMATTMRGNVAESARIKAPLLQSIAPGNRHVFLQPPAALSGASLALAKETLDALAGQVADGQIVRAKGQGKRKRGEEKIDTLKIRSVHVDGFETGQVWQQAKRIVTATLKEVEESLRALEGIGVGVGGGSENDPRADSASAPVQNEGEGVPDKEVSSSGSELASDDESSGVGEDDEEEAGERENDELGDGQSLADGSEADFEVRNDDWEEDDEDVEHDDRSTDQFSKEYVEDPNGLNDGFFSIDEFNKQTQWLEEQDARADPNTDQVSDDEELDWHTDPMAAPSTKKAGQTTSMKESHDEDAVPELDEEQDDEDNGPTFGDMDLDAPEGASEDEMEDDGMGDGLGGELDLTANDIFYKDFFAPPPRKVTSHGKRKSRDYVPRSKPDDADVERAMNNVRRDLFDDLSEQSDLDDALSDVSAGDPKSRRSAHERRQAKLAEEIRKLEAEAVAKRDWTLSGEAAAAERPINSLLGQDLAFEHVGKPVPVITEEVSESLEALIKRRILAGEFDELVRRRPDASDLPNGNTRRGLVELDDSKAKQSLAEIYEEEHVKNTNPDAYVSKADEKLRREEREVEAMWKDVCARLDALSSWHYKPKPAAPSLTVVADVATISMEDAQPATAQGVHGGESMIAPQEVYNPGKDTAEQGEVVAKSGLPVARQEMSREEKLRRRRREKERIRKTGGDGGSDGKRPLSKKAQEKKDTIAELKKGGVRVINRKGEVVDVDGNKARAEKRAATSGSFKL
jgi:U3 small nucleolar RNA-associated protein MPP10